MILKRDKITPEWMEASANDIQWRGYRLQVIDGKKVWSGFTPEGLAGAE